MSPPAVGVIKTDKGELLPAATQEEQADQSTHRTLERDLPAWFYCGDDTVQTNARSNELLKQISNYDKYLGSLAYIPAALIKWLRELKSAATTQTSCTTHFSKLNNYSPHAHTRHGSSDAKYSRSSGEKSASDAKSENSVREQRRKHNEENRKKEKEKKQRNEHSSKEEAETHSAALDLHRHQHIPVEA